MNKLYLKNLILFISVIFSINFNNKMLTMEQAYSVENLAIANKLNELGQNGVFLAYKNGDIDTAKFFEKNGVPGNINSQDKERRTATFYAYSDGNFELAERLIDNGAYKQSLLMLDSHGRSTAFHACMAGKFELAKKLLDLMLETEQYDPKYYFSSEKTNKNPMNLTDYDGQTPLFYSCIEGKTNIVKLFIALGANINVVDRFGHTPIYYAQKNSHKKIVKFLKKSGAIIGEKNTTQQANTATNMPAKTSYNIPANIPANIPDTQSTNTAKIIDEHENDIESTDLENTMYKCFGEPEEENSETDYDWQNELFLAYSEGNFDIVDKILNNKNTNKTFAINQEDEIGNTPIFHAIINNIDKDQTKYKNEEKIKSHVSELIKRGAKVNHKNKINQTPILFAFSFGLKEVVSLLKENGADKYKPEDLVDDMGQNPIFIAYCSANFKAVQKLKNWGFKGQINMENVRNQTPFYTSLTNGRLEVAQKLMNAKIFGAKYGEKFNAKGNINSENKLCMNPLFHAYLDGDISAAEELKNNATKYGFKENAKGNVLTKNSQGRSPLFCAYACGYIKIIKILKSEIIKEQEKLSKNNKNYKKPDPSTTGIYEIDNNGWTPAFLACSFKFKNTINALYEIKNTCKDWDSYINKKDNNGKTPLDIAIENPMNEKIKIELIEFLQSSGAKPAY